MAEEVGEKIAMSYIFRCETYGWNPSIAGYEAYKKQVLNGVRQIGLPLQEGLSDAEGRVSSELPDTGRTKQTKSSRAKSTRKRIVQE